MRRPGVWETELGAATSTAESSQQDNLASLYRPPLHLLFDGSFYKVYILLSLDCMICVSSGGIGI